MIITLLVVAAFVAGQLAGVRDGRRVREIELRVALHRGEDIHALLRDLP